MKKVIFSKYSNERSREFAIRTEICEEENGKRTVRKTACYPEGKAHLERTVKWYERLEKAYEGTGISMNRCHLTEDGMEPEYVEGRTLEEELDDMLAAGRVQECICRLLEYIGAVKKAGQAQKFRVTEAFKKVFGEVLLPRDLTCGEVTDIDMVTANVVCCQNGWVHMDYEWTFDFPIPVHFVIYRILLYYLEKGKLREPLRREELYDRAGLTEQEIGQYQKMEAHFQDYLTGNRTPLRNLYESVSPGYLDFRREDQMRKAAQAASVREQDTGIEMCIDSVEETADTVYIQGWAVSRKRKTLDFHVEDGKGHRLQIMEIQRMGRRDVDALFGITDLTCLSGFCIRCRYEKEGKRENRYVVTAEDGNSSASMTIRPRELMLRHSRAGRKLLAMTGRGPEHGVKYRTPYEMGLLGETGRFRLEEQRYDSYRQAVKLTEREKKLQRQKGSEQDLPVSVVAAVKDPDLNLLKEMIISVLRQTYPGWELCLADGSSTDRTKQYLEKLCREESRVHYVRLEKEKSEADCRSAGLGMAQGEYVFFLGQEDTLEADALFELVQTAETQGKPEILYSDSDSLQREREMYEEPLFKPDFSLYLLRSMNYIGRCYAVKKSLAEEVGSFDTSCQGADDYDYLLRCCERAEQICHIPRVLWHQRCRVQEDPERLSEDWDAGKKALDHHYERCGIGAETVWGEMACTYRTRWKISGSPQISVIIPNMDHSEDLKTCIRSLQEKTTWENYEILIVENNSREKKTFACYEALQRSDERIRVLTWDGSFNYSAINNYAASQAEGEYLLFLNNDTEAISRGWMEEMLGICQQPEVGVVGAKLYYPDGTIQHAGVILGLNGIAGHLFVGQPGKETGYMGKAVVMQDLSAVTAACLMTKREVFSEIGGFDENLKVALNDVDYCLRAGKTGKHVVFTPFSRWIHYESKSRGLEDTPEKKKRYEGEVALFRDRWKHVLEKGDPFYSPSLSLTSWNCALRIPKQKKCGGEEHGIAAESRQSVWKK